jgi:uncharacterized membrane protein
MTAYTIALVLHLTALSLWLGHMFVWSLLIGPALKRVEPAATAEILRDASLFRGGLGWPALAILVPTGVFLLRFRGIMPGDLLESATYQGSFGTLLAIKLAMVAAMIGYQAWFSHRRAPIAIYFDMLAAVIIIACSVVIVRGWI